MSEKRCDECRVPDGAEGMWTLQMFLKKEELDDRLTNGYPMPENYREGQGWKTISLKDINGRILCQKCYQAEERAIIKDREKEEKNQLEFNLG
jgi:hypothetical protein